MAPPSNAPKPWRTIGLIVAVLAVLGGVMFWQTQGKPQPKLALDLSSGTTVTLTAQVPGGGKPSADSMREAINIIRDRVNGTGVSEAEVSKEGDNNIVVAVPGEGQKRVVQLVGTTAELRFRQVIAEAKGTPTKASSTPTPSASPSDGKKDGKKNGAKGDDDKKDSSAARPSSDTAPSGTPTAHGRAVSKALTKPSSSPSGSTSGSTSPSTSPSPNPSGAQDPAQGSGKPEIDKSVLAKFKKLDCAKQKSSSAEHAANEQIVACDQDKKVKFILAPAKVLGQDVTEANAGLPEGALGEQWQVNLGFNGHGSTSFGNLTTKVAQQPMGTPARQVAIVLDGEVVSHPEIKEAITAGSASISGDFTQREADDLANVLKYGALPLKFTKSSIQSVSPTLGGDQLTGGLIAGAIGLGLVVLYSLLYYRGLGIVSILSLAVAGVATYEAIVLLGLYMNFRLSLAGIAGVIVAVGITADSFIVYFERLRDEVREGASLRTAVERGWKRARRTVLVADAVSLMAAVVLWLVSVGGVQGFAFTLGLTTLIDVIVVFLFTKPLVSVLARTKFYGRGHPWSGLDARRLGGRKAATRRSTGRTSGSNPKEA